MIYVILLFYAGRSEIHETSVKPEVHSCHFCRSVLFAAMAAGRDAKLKVVIIGEQG